MQALGGDTRPWPWSITKIPTTIRELVGMSVRIVRKGDVVAQDYQPGRVTIFINTNGQISDIQFEPELPAP